jgi:hypothetical protein
MDHTARYDRSVHVTAVVKKYISQSDGMYVGFREYQPGSFGMPE